MITKREAEASLKLMIKPPEDQLLEQQRTVPVPATASVISINQPVTGTPAQLAQSAGFKGRLDYDGNS